ncbi:MAG: hypothetical protein J6P35_02365 [Aeriscardovia sp.]|nr:hypothetical protein [Aeriscardovia sp.]
MAKGGRPWKVAVIGAGPAGIYASDILLKQLAQKAEELGISKEAEIDVFEKNPAPYGLVRYGVAPDHPAIKLISRALDKALSSEKISLFCNVCYGRDLSLTDLLRRYDAVIFATGAGRDKKWELGQGIEGVCGAGRVAGWYNAFPGICAPSLATPTAAVVGGGNTALDVARVLLQDPYPLSSTDMPQEIWRELAASSVKEVHIFVRRGPAFHKFSVQQIRQLKSCSRLIVDEFSRRLMGAEAAPSSPAVLAAWRELQEASNAAPSPKKCYLHFASSVSSLFAPNGRLEGLWAQRNGGSGTEEKFFLETGLCVSAIGWEAERLPGLPFDSDRGIVSNQKGRVSEKAYVTGWAKRGCEGLIGSTKSDAAETVESILADWGQKGQGEVDSTSTEEFLQSRKIRFSKKAGWFALENYESSLGRPDGKARVKVKSAFEMNRVSGLE